MKRICCMHCKSLLLPKLYKCMFIKDVDPEHVFQTDCARIWRGGRSPRVIMYSREVGGMNQTFREALGLAINENTGPKEPT